MLICEEKSRQHVRLLWNQTTVSTSQVPTELALFALNNAAGAVHDADGSKDDVKNGSIINRAERGRDQWVLQLDEDSTLENREQTISKSAGEDDFDDFLAFK